MRAAARLLGPVAATVLAVAPIGDATILLAIVASLNLGLAAIALREVVGESAAAPAQPDDPTPVNLLRRTAPQLRPRRPFGVIEAQVRWRQAAEAHRRSRASPQ